ncbi:MBL fold metallo-hydrolase [Bacterioplanoides sp. SCSIO 12839]|uniref:MBL fold metallo-hydrolase n=1 Tax=Bacterioplanoides sp. SCSIO 12839 TaxID=2829569 RepID=UPI0021074BDB|nr:MBL fold metallo-hydrolase [Bacterioplanoides sp. SCSIO 12839]UTW49388.1 MBL fold metallo-hydrolase [Bacterioplanoides sp. SCSIO 12839]
MRYASLGSGSRGNSTLIEYQQQCILIDCGFSRKVTLQRMAQLDIDPAQLKAVWVTHEHSDHAKGVQGLCEALEIPFYASFGTARKMEWLEHPLWRCVRGEQIVNLAGLAVTSVTVPHDAQEPLQYVISDQEGHKLGVLSDLGSLTPHIIEQYAGCHALQIEANHDPQLLQVGPYPPSLRARVAGNYGHLNNHQCAELVARVSWPGLKKVTAGHISEKNNDRTRVQELLAPVLNCLPPDVELLEQDAVSEWYQLAL